MNSAQPPAPNLHETSLMHSLVHPIGSCEGPACVAHPFLSVSVTRSSIESHYYITSGRAASGQVTLLCRVSLHRAASHQVALHWDTLLHRVSLQRVTSHQVASHWVALHRVMSLSLLGSRSIGLHHIRLHHIRSCCTGSGHSPVYGLTP